MTYAEAVARILGLRGGEHAGHAAGPRAHRGAARRRSATPSSATASPRSAAPTARAPSPPCSPRSSQRRRPPGRPLHLAAPLLVPRAHPGGRPGRSPRTTWWTASRRSAPLVARLDATVFEATTALALDHFARERGGRGRARGRARRAPRRHHGGAPGGGGDRPDRPRPRGRARAPRWPEIAAREGGHHPERRGPVRRTRTRRPRPCSCARAEDVDVPLLVEGRDLRVDGAAFSLRGQRLTCAGPGWRIGSARLRLLGVYQPANALLAAAAARVLGIERGRDPRWACREVRWPGRFQILRQNPVIVLDGAHNPAGARALAASLSTYFPDQPVDLRARHLRRQGRGGDPRRAPARRRPRHRDRARQPARAAGRRPSSRWSSPTRGGSPTAPSPRARSPPRWRSPRSPRSPR